MTDLERPARWHHLRLAAAVTLTLTLLVGGLWAWWRGRPEWHLAVAGEYLEAGEPVNALDWLELPKATAATRERALILLARVALARGRPAEAVTPLVGVDLDGPNAAEAAYWKGRTLYQVKRTHDAVFWFYRSVQIRPDKEALRWLAAATNDLGDQRTAIASLRELTHRHPEDAPAWRSLGLLYKDDLQEGPAVAAYEATLKADPHQPQVRFELAEVLLTIGRPADACRQLAACRGSVPEPDRLLLEARCLLELMDTGAARERLDTALALDPNHPGLLAQRAGIELVEARPAEAVARLDRSLAADPFQPEALHQRGLALRKLGRRDEAGRDFAAAAELRRGRSELRALNREASLKPGDPDLRHRIGQLCIRLGNTELASWWFRSALACDPKHAAARDALRDLKAREATDHLEPSTSPPGLDQAIGR